MNAERPDSAFSRGAWERGGTLREPLAPGYSLIPNP